MTQTSQHGTLTAPRASGSGNLFGIPLGDLGLFTSLVMGVAVGFAAFFSATFLAIIGLLAYKIATSRMPDFTLTYKWVGLPVGIAVLLLALAYFGTLWVKRKLRKA